MRDIDTFRGMSVISNNFKMLLLTLCVLIISTSRYGVRAEAINPLKNPAMCGIPTCDIDSENEKFRYQQNVVYKYLYESSVRTHFDGTDDNDPHSEMYISAFIDLSFPSKCQGQLQLSSVQLKHQNVTVKVENKPQGDYEYEDDEEDVPVSAKDDNEKALHQRSHLFSKDVESMTLRFDFRDGLIQEVCPDAEEQVWVTNFKRGILSALQNTMYRLDLDHKSTETDVSGKCNVNYQFMGSVDTSIVINKTKDISSCQNRNKFKSIIQTTPYEFGKSGISWWPIYNSSSYCELSIDNYVYNNIECHERHVLIPFSNENHGAVSESFMRMKLISETNETLNDEIYIDVRKSLLYDHSFSPKPVHNDIKLSRDYLKQMCALGFPNIQREFPDKFVKFLSATKHLSDKGLNQLLARAGGICNNGRKHVLESLPYIGSSASVELMKDLLIKGKLRSQELTPEIKEAWLLSMFYLPRPDLKIIETMFSLIQHYETEPNPMFVLIPSAVTHTYCRNNADCRDRTVVMNIVKYLERVVEHEIVQDLSHKSTFRKLIVAMKGLGNIGIMSKSLEATLKEVIIDEFYSDDVKLQVIQMFRKTNCGTTRDYFVDIYQNFTQSVEVRIASYLQLMRCPTYLTVKDIKSFLQHKEHVNQVGSFVWSHLKNMAKTSSPQKIEIQALLVDDTKVDDKFRMDFRKYSKNFEQSLFFDEYNFGLSGESNVIFGIESYFPRSFSFNGTVDLFGESVNALEFNVRMQGLENYIESIIGLDGPLNFNRLIGHFKYFYEKIKEFFNIDEDFLTALMRSRRSAENQIDGFAYRPKYDFNSPNGYFEQKIFGNDINFYEFHGLDELSDVVKKLIPIEQVKNIFSQNEEFFIDSGTLVDVAYTVPSSTGFPLILNVFGAYSLDINYYASVNNKNVWDTRSLNFTGRLRPSLSMEINSAMQMDLFYALTDVKFKSNIYSNYALETYLNVKDYTHASLKVELPQDRNDIFSIRTQLISKIEGTEALLYGITNRFVNTSCSWPTIDETLGLKVCIDYSLPDVSDQSKAYPSLILSGPVVFDIHLDKADISAKTFSFDYNWKPGEDISEGSVTFETPNSKIPRKLSAVLLTNPTDYNFTMIVVNGEKNQKVLGILKNSPDHQSLDFQVLQNEKINLKMEMSLKKEYVSKSHRIARPQFLLKIQDQNVAGMKGEIRIMDKSDIRQYNYDLNFETKKLMSRVNGTLALTETSTRMKSTLLYKFSGQKQETVDFLLELINRSQRLINYVGELTFESSAYPNYNFYSNASFLQAMGHAEFRLDFNNAPDLTDLAHTLSMKVSLAKSSEGIRNSETTFAVEVTRPLNNVDLKFYVKYDEFYKNGTEHTVQVIVRYAPEQEVFIKTSVFIPKGNLFGFDATFLLTAPQMGSCSADIMIKERMRKDYMFDVKAKWFGDENIKLLGTYQDRTSSVKRFYKVKSIISSNQFKDINLMLRYSRDLREMKIDLKTEYNETNYSFLMESLEPEPLVVIFKTELNWADKKFSLKSNSTSKDTGRIKTEIHLDRLRDMHIEIWGLAKSFSQHAGIEFKWDANRDPTQKIILSYDFDKPRDKVYTGNVLISYPDRTINGDMKISNEAPYVGKLKVSWSADESIDASYSVGTEMQDYRKLWAIFKVETPFAGWKNNRVNASIYHHKNLYSINFATVWADSKSVAIDFFLDYLLSEREVSSDFRASIQSTIKDVPVVFTHFKFNQTANELESDMLFKHNKLISGDGFKIFSVKSLWKRAYDSMYRNVSGSIQFITPYENYTSGALVTKFSITKERELFGVIDMDIDTRLYAFAVEGYLRKLWDNMITFNLSTPIENFSTLLGKFGIIEHKKYIIADLKTSNKSLGVEILYDFQSITDFDLKFYAATPQPAFERILAIGKIKDSVMHIEGGWNKINMGFKIVSHFLSVNNFEYSYQVFTPLPHFELNGLVFRFITSGWKNFDVEGSFKIGKYKLGLKGFGEPKKQLLNQLGLQKASHVREEIYSADDLDDEDAIEDVKIDIDLNEFYSIAGNFEVCTIIWSPIRGTYEIQQVEDTYYVDALINIPKGVVTLSNKFIAKNNTTDFMNRLKIDTPIAEYKSINSNFKLKMPTAQGLTARFDVGIKNKALWKNYGFKLNYDLPKSSQSKVHDVSLIILYPLMNTSRINVHTRLELAKGGRVSQANFTLDGFNTRLDLSGFFTNDNEQLNAGFNVLLHSPIINHYSVNAHVHKSMFKKDNLINMGFAMIDDGIENRFDADLIYRLDPNHIIDGYLTIESNIFPIEKFNTSVYISETLAPRFDISIRYSYVHETFKEIKFMIKRESKKFDGEIVTPFKEISNVRFVGFLEDTSQPGAYKFKGKVFKGISSFDFEGDVVLQRNLPSQADLFIRSSEGDTRIVYNLSFEEFKRSIKAECTRNKEFLNFQSELYIQNLLDWAYNVKIVSSRNELSELMLSTMLTPLQRNQYEASFEMTSPWTDHFIEKVNISSVVTFNANDGNANLFYEISKHTGESNCAWKWLDRSQKQEYLFKLNIDPKTEGKNFNTEISYLNPQKAPTDILFKINVKSLWMLHTKARFSLLNNANSAHDFGIVYELSLPKPVESTHKIEASYKGTHFPPKFIEKSNNDWSIKYSNQAMNAKLEAKGEIESSSNVNNLVNLEWGNTQENNVIESDFKIESIDSKTFYKWQLNTPSIKDEKTLIVSASHFDQDEFMILHADINYPESKGVITADVAFEDMQNAKGSINSSLPTFNTTWFHVNFDFDSQDEESTKYIKATWPDNYAVIDSKSNYVHDKDYKEWKGTIKAEIPLQTKHNIQIIYGLEEKMLITTGDTSVEYNNENILNSHYTCKTEVISPNHQKETIDLSLENDMRPLGIHYTHEKNKNPEESFDFSKKHLELFDLSKDNRFNITSEFSVEIKDERQIYKFVAFHPNKTISWISDYTSLDELTHQSSKIELSDTVWLNYNFEHANLSTSDIDEQKLKFSIEYPGRKIKIGGNYELKSDALDTNVNLSWNKKESKSSENSEDEDENIEQPSMGEEKSVEGKFKWQDLTDASKDNHQSVLLVLKHPKFEKDVTIQGAYFRDAVTTSKIELDIDYTEDEDHHARFISEIKNLSDEVGHKNYTIHVKGDHQASEFHVLFDGSIGLKSNYYKMEAAGTYTRDYTRDQELKLLGFIDTDRKEVKYYRSTPSKTTDFYTFIESEFPIYSIEGVYIDSPDYDMAGDLVLDLKKKLIRSDVNLTADDLQKFQIRGSIPDTRSALLNVWRDYDDIRIDDVSYFIQMNHSRLITSKLLWRPKMKKEIKENIKDFLAARYLAFADELDYWIKTGYTEVRAIVSGIWDESSSYTAEFREDFAALKDIEEDLSAFKSFLNESYYNDDFYIQSLMNYTFTILDELALSNHIQTIPQIFKEIWEVLGESSAAFKNSIFGIVETMKSSYKDSIDIFNKLIHGNFMDYVTAFLNNIIESYDRFVKNLHITFMNSIETMWDNLAQTFSIYWNRILQNIEPQILRSIHYVESTLWSISSEIFDFMYNRTNEIMESPYFMKVSNITHDLDVLYQDLRHNDLFTNFKKYSGLMSKFLKEKFISVVPFGKEMKIIVDDISNTFEDLRKAEFVKEYFDRLDEIKMKLKWLIDEFQLDKQLGALFEILKKKLNRITQNALETEDVYREAKTKFIFDPDVGIIDWEQKLPISWHAFNETPQFEEIPEYKFILEVQDFLFTTKNSSFNFYYGLFVNEPMNLVPPLKSRALLIASRHIVTFDKTSLDFDSSEFNELFDNSQTLSDQCSYLLAHDFVEQRFTIILKPSSISDENQRNFLSKSLFIQSKSNKVEIELGNPLGEIKVGDRLTTLLPATSGDLLITRDVNVVKVISQQGFMVQCNLEFDMCIFELSGWYFGKTAGVLGTMNNEGFDDFTTSDNAIAVDKNEFVDSWTTGKSSCSRDEEKPEKETSEFYEGLHRLCEMFFRQKTSYFTSCFSALDPESFYETCLSMGKLPRYQTSDKNIEKAACTSAISYIEACAAQNVPLRIPDFCIHCSLPNGSHVAEGTFVELKDEQVPAAVDVVFLVESKPCNADSSRRRFMSTLVTSLTTEFKQRSLKDIRFALVGFGGSKEFAAPRSVTSNGRVFTDTQNIQSYFNHLKFGNTSEKETDVFFAVTKASELIFRPGAIKIFVLALCSECEVNTLKFDFKSVSQLLKEKDMTLHILSTEIFNKKFVYGIDNTKAYTKKDQQRLVGDEKQRPQVKIGRKLDKCGSLAFDTEGSIFTTGNRVPNEYKMLANVFAKRIANTQVKPCHMCECEGHNTGASYLTCTTCENMMFTFNEGDDSIDIDDDEDYYDES